MRYAIRSIKYLLFLCVLYVALEWGSMMISSSVEYANMDIWELIQLRLATDRGKLLVGALVVLAACYPLFGFMRSHIAGCNLVRDGIRIDNAMRLYGFKLVEDRGDVKIYRADSFLRRAMLMFEDEIELRVVVDGIELKGMRRSVARIAYQLRVYLNNSRFE